MKRLFHIMIYRRLGNFYILSRTKIRVGEHKISNEGRDCDNNSPPHQTCNLGVQDFDVERILWHPEYNSPNIFQNDIAIVKLDRKVSRNGKCFK